MTEYVWLIEQLAESNKTSFSPTVYYSGYELDGKPAKTHDPYKAKRFYGRDAARNVLRLNFMADDEGAWAAVEHGFDDDSMPSAA